MFENLTEKLQRTFKNLRGQGKLTEEHLDAALGGDSRGAARRRRERGRGGRAAGEYSREVAGQRSDAATFAGPASGEGGARRAVGDAGQARQAAVCFAAAFGVDDCGLARFGQDDDDRQTGEMAGGAWAPAAGGFDGRVPARGARAAGASGEGRWHGAVAGRGHGQAAGNRAAARSGKRNFRRSDVILVDTAGRLHIDDDLMNELSMLKKELQPSGDFVHRGRDDRARRGAVGGRVSQAAGTDWRDSDEVGRRCARRRGAFDRQSDRSAGEVRGLRAKNTTRWKDFIRSGSFRACWAWATSCR